MSNPQPMTLTQWNEAHRKFMRIKRAKARHGRRFRRRRYPIASEIHGVRWRKYSVELLRAGIPDATRRIAHCLNDLAFVCASSCEFDDRRHMAKVAWESLRADLGIPDTIVVSDLFEDTFPMDRQGKSTVIHIR